MEQINLAVSKREETGRKIRKAQNNRIPGVVYGHGFETVNVWVDATSLTRTFEKAGTNTIVSVEIGQSEPVKALIHDFQVNPITNKIIHVDFFHVRMDEKVETHIPIVITGESPAIKNMGGTLNHIESITVRALPGDLIHEITVDITKIETFEDRITIADLNLSENIEILTDEQTPVASVIAPRTQEEVDAADDEVDADVSKVEGALDDSDQSSEEASEEKKEGAK